MQSKMFSPAGLELNDKQIEFIYWAKRWYENQNNHAISLDNDNRFRLLVGAPGTGKSTTVFTLIAQLKIATPAVKIAIAAPTHEAKDVLIEMAIENQIAAPINTIYSLLGLRPRILDSGEILFVNDPASARTIELYDLVIIDEASMINENLWTIIKNANFPLTLLMGDDEQLRPVKSATKSVVFTQVSNRFELKKIVRFKGAIASYCDCIKKSQHYVYPFAHEDDQTLITCKKREWFERLANAAANDESYRAVAFTNRNVKVINQAIRKEYYRRKLGFSDAPEQLRVLDIDCNLVQLNKAIKVLDIDCKNNLPEYVKGDKLICRQPIHEYSQTFQTNVLVIPNGTRLTVKTVGRDIKEELECYSLWVEWLEAQSSGQVERKVKLIHVLAEESKQGFNERLDKLRKLALSAKRHSWQRTQAWKKFYRAKDCFADVQYAFCTTIHKAQGRSFNKIFVYNDLLQCRDNDLQKELNYVACSRAKKQLIICQ